MSIFPNSDKVSLQTLSNIFDKSTRKVDRVDPGKPLRAYCPREWRTMGDAVRCVRNGVIIYRHEWDIVARSGDELIFYLIPGTVAALSSLIISLVIAAVSYGIQALTAPAIEPSERDLDESPTYGWNSQFNTVRPGTPIPIIYGQHRFGGHIISHFERQSSSAAAPREGALHTLIGLCAGPIEAVDAIQINGNDASEYEAVHPEVRLGESYQAPLHGFSQSIVPVSKDEDLESGITETYTTTDEIDSFEAVIQFPSGLFRVSNKGQYKQHSVELRFAWNVVGSAVVTTETVTVSEKVESAFKYFYRPDGSLPRAKYEIHITRITPDSGDPTVQGDTVVSAINEITDASLTYPNIALLAIRQLPSSKVSGGAPNYSCLVKGKRVKIYSTPSAYTVAWSDNPAWCCLDYIEDTRWGLGTWLAANGIQVNINSFIAWAAFCDELVVKDAEGEREKRFRLDLVIDGSMSIIETLKQICSTGQAFLTQRGNELLAKVDWVEEPVQLFTMGRIKRNSFQVAKFSKLETANYLIGEFYNADNDYEADTLPKEDQTLASNEEPREQTISLLGTTRTSQANRILSYHILANRLIRRQLEADLHAEALACEAGDVVRIAHDVPGWGYSGKLLAVDSTGTSLRLDREITIEADTRYELTVIHPATDDIDIVEVTSLPGTSDLISVSGDWTTLPVVGADYSFGAVTQSTVLYRLMSITQGQHPWQRRIRAREYNAAVYDLDMTVLAPPSPSRLPDPHRIPADVTDLRLQERQVYAEDGSINTAIDVHFTLPVTAGARAQIYWRELGDLAWRVVASPVSVGFASILQDIESPGYTYEVSVVSLSPSGNSKGPDQGVQSSIRTVGTTRVPDKVVNFLGNRTLTGLVFTWDPVDPVANFDLNYYEVRQGPTWESAIVLGRTTDTFLETSVVVKGTQTFLIKAVNTAGKESTLVTSLIMVVDGRIGENVIVTRQEDPTWTGVRENMTLSGDDLVMDAEADIVAWRGALSMIPMRSQIGAGGFGLGYLVTASYTTAIFQVANDALRCLVAAEIEIDQIDVSMYWDSPDLAGIAWESDFARSRQWGVAPAGKVATKLEMRFSTTTSNDSAFGPWQERPQNIEVLCKWAQARISITIRDPSYTCKLKKLRLGFDVPDVTDAGDEDTSAVGTVAVAFNKTYNAAPKVTVMIVNATAGDEAFVTAITATQFTLEVKNSGSRVVRNVHWQAIGF